MNPKYSIIVPIYNSEKTLRRCVDSILAQTYTNFELLLIDDGSTDNSYQIILNYEKCDCRIKAIHKKNGGVSSARNTGLDNVKGEWVLFADSDDEILPDWIKNFNEQGEIYDIIVQGLYYRRQFVSWPKEIPDSLFIGKDGIKSFIIKWMSLGQYGYTTTKSFRRTIIDRQQIRFDIKCHFREDELFITQYLTFCNKIKTINKANYIYELPLEGKKYRGNSYYGLFRIFENLNFIFKGKFNTEISKIHHSNLKSAIICKIINKEIPTKQEVGYYIKLFNIIKNKKLKDYILNTIIKLTPISKIARKSIIIIHKYC